MTLLLSLLLLWSPVKVEHGRFNILKDGKKIGSEEFTVEKRGPNYFVEGRASIGDINVTSKMELDDKLTPISYEVSNREGVLQLHVASPVSELKTLVRGETTSADFRFPDGGVILDNNFFHHYLILLYRAQMGQTSFGVFVPQDMSVGSAMVRNAGGRTYNVEVGEVHLEATTDADGSLVRLTVPAAKVVVER